MIVRMIIIALVLFSLSLNTTTVTSSINYNTTSEPSNLALTTHAPIEITSDSDFEVFLGTGTEEDPYLIEGYNITTTDDSGIYISGTTKYFIVCSCYIDAEDRGIYIDNVADGTANVINNTCNNNGWGILLWYSGSSTVTNNTCNNNWDGIVISSSGNLTVANNTCSNNNNWGILLGSSDCVVTYNLLQENEEYGVYFWYGCDNNLIHHNTFVDNNLGDFSQAFDYGRKNKWYDPETKEGNYWSDLGDDCTYKIDGKSHSKDLYPLNRAQSCPNPITMTILSIVLPLLVCVAILALVVPNYFVPYTRKTIIPYFLKRKDERCLRTAKFLSCTNCGNSVKFYSILCENCGISLPEKRMKVLDIKTNRIIVIVYLSLLFLSTAILPWVVVPGYPSEGWLYFGVFGLLGTFIPLAIIMAIIITTILFRSKIARMKLWKKVVLLITLCVLILAVILAPFQLFWGIF